MWEVAQLTSRVYSCEMRLSKEADEWQEVSTVYLCSVELFKDQIHKALYNTETGKQQLK